MIISEKYAYDAWLEYLIQTNLGENVEKIFIYYQPQVQRMAELLKRNNVNYIKTDYSFYL